MLLLLLIRKDPLRFYGDSCFWDSRHKRVLSAGTAIDS